MKFLPIEIGAPFCQNVNNDSMSVFSAAVGLLVPAENITAISSPSENVGVTCASPDTTMDEIVGPGGGPASFGINETSLDSPTIPPELDDVALTVKVLSEIEIRVLCIKVYAKLFGLLAPP